MLTISDEEISSKINQFTLHTLPAVVKDLCRSDVGLQSSILRCLLCMNSFTARSCFFFKKGTSLTQPAQGQVKQPKASIVNKSQPQAKIVVHVVAQNYLHGYTEMLSCTCYPWQAKSKSCVILGSPPVRFEFLVDGSTHTTASQNKCQEKPKNVQGFLHQEIYLTLSYHVYQHNWRY